MALDGDMVTAAVAGLSLIIGYVIGRMSSGSGSKANQPNYSCNENQEVENRSQIL